jgi:hypothetical protein
MTIQPNNYFQWANNGLGFPDWFLKGTQKQTSLANKIRIKPLFLRKEHIRHRCLHFSIRIYYC